MTQFGQNRQEPVCNLWVMDSDGSNARLLWEGEIKGYIGWPIYPPIWSLDEQVLRVADSWRTDKTYHFYSVDSGELLFTSDDPGGGPDYSPLFTDRSRSPSGRLKVNFPSIPDFEFCCINHCGAGTGLKVYWIGEEDSETLVLDINAHIYSFQWHPRGDILLFSAGQKSESPDMPESSDIYIAGFPN